MRLKGLGRAIHMIQGRARPRVDQTMPTVAR